MITRMSNQQNPFWYKDAVIYQLHVRAFYDSNEDGIGDFQGLIQKLDYLANLGVNAIWLLPFYPSPLRDDGYDIADYSNINPAYGTLADFQQFLEEAHARNMRVITELVINHTSDQHEWFQKSRRAKPGTYWRDFYVWSDDPRKYKGTRIIFKDFEASNWAWDPIAKSYFWHRFYSHQPDLNFDNPEVQKKVFEALDFWMEMGVDGLRLDAVPYLFEREGTSNENLPETHEFLKTLRTHIDTKFPGSMLLAEANQWPEDAVNYFGKGDECHMNFHFPLMPRLFMALKMEDRYSIIDILKQTPEIPENCQWATFLRNHDELTLEMVTDEERDYMYKVYANDPRARINLGVRRRLAPLAGNDRRQIELLNSLLFSLPGSPIIYYGDEIGMGDNIYLGDRDGVRTPFQWSCDRNAGFSKANSQKLYLPIISTSEYHAESINVENLKANPTSLLWWMNKVIALRGAMPELSRGKLEFIESNNPKVLTYLRHIEGSAIVCVVNLSRTAQFVDIDLSRFKGCNPKELFGQTEFPMITENSYVVTLSPYAFYWLHVSDIEAAKKIDNGVKKNRIEVGPHPLFSFSDRRNWNSIVHSLKDYLPQMRWFGGKGRRITNVELIEFFQVTAAESSDKANLMIIRVSYAEGLPETYLMGLAHYTGAAADKWRADHPGHVIAETTYTNNETVTTGIFFDALLDERFSRSILETIVRKRQLVGIDGKLVSEFQGETPNQAIEAATSANLEQSNSSFLFGKQYYLKFYRRLEEGENPEIEIGRFLAAQDFKATASFLGALSYKRGNTLISLAVVEKVVENECDGWSLMIGQVGQIAERIQTEGVSANVPLFPEGGLKLMRGFRPPHEYQEIAGYTFRLAHQLGAKTAEMHLAMSSEDRNPDFIPEAFTPFHQRSVFQSFRNLTDKTMDQLKKSLSKLEGPAKEMAESVLGAQDVIYKKFAMMKSMPIDTPRIRIHGDYHLGQVLFTGQDFCIVDFEGEPARGLGERKLKRSPLKDVAGMLRSFDYAAEFHLKKFIIRDMDREQIEKYLHGWASWAKVEFLNAYLDKVQGTGLIPEDLEQVELLLQMFLLEKALYEVGYELRNRPEWATIPLRGVLNTLDRTM